MSDPDWLVQARAEGRITETRVNPAAIPAGQTGKASCPKAGTGVELTAEMVLAMSERQWQEFIVGQARARGWKVVVFNKVLVTRPDGTAYWATPFGADGKGFPDTQMLRADEQIVAELKVDDNTTSPEQDEWITAFEEAGVRAFVWHPKNWDTIRSLLH